MAVRPAFGGSLRWRTGSSRWRVGPATLALAVAGLLATAPPVALAGYQASVYSNWTAFNPCIGRADPFPDKMRLAAVAAFADLGFTTTGFTRAGFTRTAFLNRTPADWAVYVHSHGDFYNNKPGFRADGGVCSGAVTTSADIATKRPSSQQTNFVIMSTCHLGESDARKNMPLVYGIEKLKAGSTSWRGPEFYLGYIGSAWDDDEWEFEVLFWDRVRGGSNVGHAFDIALANGSYR